MLQAAGQQRTPPPGDPSLLINTVTSFAARRPIGIGDIDAHRNEVAVGHSGRAAGTGVNLGRAVLDEHAGEGPADATACALTLSAIERTCGVQCRGGWIADPAQLPTTAERLGRRTLKPNSGARTLSLNSAPARLLG